MHQSPQKNPARRDRWVEFEDREDGAGKRGWRAAASKTRRATRRDEQGRVAKEERRFGGERPR